MSFLLKQHIIIRQAYFISQIIPSSQYNFLAFQQHMLNINLKRKLVVLFLKLLQKQWFLQFASLPELTAIDFPSNASRFKVIYALLSYKYTSRVALSTFASETSFLQSVTSVFAGAKWQEREIWDLFGIFFQGNDDLRRILTDYGFWGHPLRKDFPLSGFYEVLYDDRKKQIIYRPVSLAQELRNFGSVNPWVFLKR